MQFVPILDKMVFEKAFRWWRLSVCCLCVLARVGNLSNLGRISRRNYVVGTAAEFVSTFPSSVPRREADKMHHFGAAERIARTHDKELKPCNVVCICNFIGLKRFLLDPTITPVQSAQVQHVNRRQNANNGSKIRFSMAA